MESSSERLEENYEIVWNGKVYPANYRVEDGRVIVTILGPCLDEPNPYFTIIGDGWSGNFSAGETITLPIEDEDE